MQTLANLKSMEINPVVKIETSNLGLRKIVISSELADAEIYLHGAHLTHFQPKGEDPLIFDATQSKVIPPHSVHAGIPVCWPWFGVHPDDSSKPQHGFARDKVWRLSSTKVTPDNSVELLLILEDDASTQLLFPYAFTLELTITIANTLTLSLKTINNDTQSFTITQALHTYFAISDIEEVEILGVEGCAFTDYTDAKKVKREAGTLQIHQEVNRVYTDTDASCSILDPGLHRKIIINKEGSRSTTIWNPWKESQIHDLPENKYRRFVCIETTNALEDARVLAPRESTILEQRIAVQAL